MRRLPAIIVLMVAMPAGLPLFAQSKAGTTVGQFLLIEPSARAAAMGNAGVSTFGEVSASFYNPAALGHMVGSDAQFTIGSWLAGISYNYAAAAVRLGNANTVLLSVTSLRSGEMEVRTVDFPQGTGERFTVQDFALGLGLSRRITDRFAAGLQLQYVQETIWHSSMTAAALDFGVLYRLPFGTYLGASLSNFGTQGRFQGRDLRVRYDQDPDRFGDNSNLPAALHTERFPLPIYFRVGVGIPLELDPRSRGLIVIDAYQPSDNTNSISFGGEWTFMDVLALRGGYQHLFQEDAETGLTLGGGLRLALSSMALRVDYAWNDYGAIGDIQRFTLGFSF